MTSPDQRALPTYPTVGETADYAEGFAAGAAAYTQRLDAVPDGAAAPWIEGYRAGQNAAVRALTDFACTPAVRP